MILVNITFVFLYICPNGKDLLYNRDPLKVLQQHQDIKTFTAAKSVVVKPLVSPHLWLCNYLPQDKPCHGIT